jgi:hypothetical protein
MAGTPEDAKSRRRRLPQMQWVHIDTAMETVYELPVITPQSNTPLHADRFRDEQEEHKWLRGFAPKKDKRCCGCFQFLNDLGAAPSPEDGNTGWVGYLWKLNSGVGESPEELADMENWRRRQFFIRDHRVEGRMLAYVSEKNGGSLQVCALLSGRGCATTVKQLPLIKLPENSEAQASHIRIQMMDYDCAVKYCDPRGTTDADYAQDVPTQLFPCAIEWRDAQGDVHHTVVADVVQDDMRTWVEYMSGKALPPCLVDAELRGTWSNAVAIRYGGEGMPIA